MLFETAWMHNNCHACRISHPEFVFTSCDQSVWKWEDQKRVFSPGLVWQITFLDWSSSSSCSCLDKWLKTPSFPIATIIFSRISAMTTFFICSFIIYLLIAYDVMPVIGDTEGRIFISQSSAQRGKQTYNYNRYINKVVSPLTKLLFYSTKMLPLSVPAIKRLCWVYNMESWDRNLFSRGNKSWCLRVIEMLYFFHIEQYVFNIWIWVRKLKFFCLRDSITVIQIFKAVMGSNRLAGPLSSLTPNTDISNGVHRHAFPFLINCPHLSPPAVRLPAWDRTFFYFSSNTCFLVWSRESVFDCDLSEMFWKIGNNTSMKPLGQFLVWL